MKQLAPIILFVYNRPQHTLQTLNALQNNELSKDSVLYIFADGIKENASSETIQKINETRKIIKNKKWCKEVFIIEREQNFGLAKSVIMGVTEIINNYHKAIVLEDDLVTSPYFLKYMNEALDKYEHINSVACISGYIYPINNLPDLFFIKGADCWGWATWKRAWDLFEPNSQILLDQIIEKGLEREFDFDGSYPYVQMLKNQVAGLNNSWAIGLFFYEFVHFFYHLP
jgi:GT2 family glycosyltransferase